MPYAWICHGKSSPHGSCVTPSIQHDRSGRRFETIVDGSHGELDYSLAAGVMTITHTGVPAAVAGRGIASALVEAALATARSEGWKVVPACSYAQAWMQRHPGYDDLRA
jgi:predicted GNAT family acetyltransferase